MRLSDSLRKELYIERAQKKLAKLYSYGDAEPEARKRLSDQLDGFIEAALLVRMIDKKVLQALIDEEHHKAFGMTREERKAKKQLDGDHPEVDWSKYELPPDLRNGGK